MSSNSLFDEFYLCLRSGVQGNFKDPGFEILPGGSLTSAQALNVYQQGYMARLVDLMADKYSAVEALLGEHGFYDLCLQYLAKYPSTDANLENYGNDFCTFLKSHSLIEDFPFLPELANLEALHSHLFHQPDEVGLQPPEISAKLNLQSQIAFVGSFFWLQNSFPISKVWTALRKDLDPPPMDLGETTILHKHQNQVYVLGISKQASVLFDNLQKGLSLETSLDGFDEVLGAQFLQLCFQNSWIRAITNSH